MQRFEETILSIIFACFIIAAFFNIPDVVFDNVKSETTQFATTVANNYQANETGPVYANTKDLSNVAPAAGDATDTPDVTTAPAETPAPATTITAPDASE